MEYVIPNELTTERLQLRPYIEEDTPWLLEIAADKAVTRYLFNFGNVGRPPEGDIEAFFNRIRDHKGMHEYAVLLRETGEPVGDMSAELADDGSAEIGWILRPGRCKKGYAFEAASAVVEMLRKAGVRRITAHCDMRNMPSRHLCERLGMMLAAVDKGARSMKAEDTQPGDEAEYVRDFA